MANKQAAVISETRPLPVGAPNCLAGKTFVFTGDFCSMTRETAADCVKRYGGRVTGAPSKKTTFVVLGLNPGPSKVAKLEALKLATLNEDEFYLHINSTVPGYVAPNVTERVNETPAAPYGTTMPAAPYGTTMPAAPYGTTMPKAKETPKGKSKMQVDDDEFVKEISVKAGKDSDVEFMEETKRAKAESSVFSRPDLANLLKPVDKGKNVLNRPDLANLKTPKTSHEQSSIYAAPKSTPHHNTIVDKGKLAEKPFARPDLANIATPNTNHQKTEFYSAPKTTPHKGKQAITSELWTEKYRPQQISDVIGNTSLIEKLKTWLTNWQQNKLSQFPKGDLSQFRAALLSGPPGEI
jgi:hypothetical protein